MAASPLVLERPRPVAAGVETDPPGSVPVALAWLLLGAGVGAGADVLAGHAVREFFAIGFAVGCVFAVMRVARIDVWRVVVAAPLLYLAMLVIAGVATAHGLVAAWLAAAFVFKAPVVLTGTAVAVVAAVLRSAIGGPRPRR